MKRLFFLSILVFSFCFSRAQTDTAGRYIPVFTTGTNVTGPITVVDSSHFSRTANEVIVTGEAEVRGIAFGGDSVAQFRISLPIASNLKKLLDCVGQTSTLQIANPATSSGFIEADSFADKAEVFFYPAIVGYARVFYSFTYQIK